MGTGVAAAVTRPASAKAGDSLYRPSGEAPMYEKKYIAAWGITHVTVTSTDCTYVGFTFYIGVQNETCTANTKVTNKASGHLTIRAQWQYQDGWTELWLLDGYWTDKSGSFITPFQFFFLAPSGDGAKPKTIRHRWYKDFIESNNAKKGNTGWFYAAPGNGQHQGAILFHGKNPWIGLQLWALSQNNTWYPVARVGFVLTTNGK